MSSSEIAALSRVHDRVVATENEKLPDILEKLLPGLLPLANKQDLRPQVLVIISNLSRRIKSLKTRLPCPALLERVVSPELLPYACNIAITLIDIALPNEPSSRRQETLEKVLFALSRFYKPDDESCAKMFTLQLNAILMYALELLPYIPSAVSKFSQMMLSPMPVPSSSYNMLRCQHSLALLWDFLLDIALVRAPLSKGGVGSVQPGLSVKRVERLCHRPRSGSSNDSSDWFLDELKEIKLRILSLLSPDWIHPAYIGAIAAACACDLQSGDNVVKDAIFKLNGLKTAIQVFHKRKIAKIEIKLEDPVVKAAEDKVTRVEVVCFLLQLCLAGGHGGFESESDVERLPLRENVRVVMLSWIKDELIHILRCPEAVFLVFRLCAQTFGVSKSSMATNLNLVTTMESNFKLQGVVLCLTNAVSQYLHLSSDIEVDLSFSNFFESNAVIATSTSAACFTLFLQCAFSALMSIVDASFLPSEDKLGTNASMSSYNIVDESQMVIKEACFLVNRLSRYSPHRFVNFEGDDIHFAKLFFRLLERSDLSGEGVSACVNALEGVKLAYVSHLNSLPGGNAEKSRRESQLKSFLGGVRGSQNAQKRVSVLPWAQSLFGYGSSFMIESMIILAGDSVDLVCKTALEQFEYLRDFLCKYFCNDWEDSGECSKKHEIDVATIFSSLLHVKDSYQLAVSSSVHDHESFQQSSAVKVVLKQVFSTASTMLELLELKCYQTYKNILSPLPQSVTELAAADEWIALPTAIATYYSSSQKSTRVSHDSILSMLKIVAASSFPSNVDPSVTTATASSIHWKTALSSSGLLPDRIENLQAPLLTEKVRLTRHCIAFAVGYLFCDEETSAQLHSEGSSSRLRAENFGRAVLTPLLLHWLGNAADGEFDVLLSATQSRSLENGNLVKYSRGYSSQAYIAQALGYLCMSSHVSYNDSVEPPKISHTEFLEQLWNILVHKLDSENARSGRGALRCMTCIVEAVSVPLKKGIKENATSVDQSSSLAIHYGCQLVDTIYSILLPVGRSVKDEPQSTKGNHSERKESCGTPKVVMRAAAEHTMMLQGVAFGCIADLASRRAFTRSAANKTNNIYCLKSFTDGVLDSIDRMQAPVVDGRANALLECLLVHLPETGKDAMPSNSINCSPHSRKDSSEECRDMKESVNSHFRCMLIQAVSQFCVNGVDNDVFQRCWDRLLALSSSEWLVFGTNGVAVRFALAEGLVRMAIGSVSNDHGTPPLMLDLLVHAENIVSALLEKYASLSRSDTEILQMGRSFSGILLLVWLRHLRQWVVLNDARSVLSPELLQRCCLIFLLLLRGHDRKAQTATSSLEPKPFLQDVCCAGLCYLYDVASQNASDGSSKEKISDLVVSTLCREKMSAQPAGVALAGETAGTSEQASSSSLEQNMQALVSQVQSEESGGQEQHILNEDSLAEAAARAQSSVNIFHAGVDRGDSSQQSGEEENYSFGVYTTICRVARKAGDSSVVFAVLSLVERDPSYHMEPYSFHYRPPVPVLQDDKLPSLIPMLYQSKFHPNGTISEVMTQLWDLLVQKHKRKVVLNIYTREILLHLCNNLSSKQWRDRESACCALESFLPSRPWIKLRPFLSNLWTFGMKVLDDIRDSTRRAAVGFMKSLSNHIVGACNPELQQTLALQDNLGSSATSEQTRIVEDATNFIIPLLLNKGLVESSPESRGFSMGLLLRVVKTTKASLRDHLPKLIDTLVEAMSAMEPQALQYLQFHTDRLKIDKQELEDTRLKLSSQSPLQDALDTCLESLCAPVVDSVESEEQMNRVSKVMTSLALQTQQGVGIPTRVTASRSFQYLLNVYVGELASESVSSPVMSGALRRSFSILLSSLIPSSPGVLASLSLKRELLISLSLSAQFLGDEFLVPELQKIMSIYLSIHKDNKRLEKFEMAKLSVNSDSNVECPIGSFNTDANSTHAKVSSVDSSEGIVVAEVLLYVTKKVGDNLLRDQASLQIESQQSLEADDLNNAGLHGFWKQLLLCAYVGSFEEEKEATEAWTALLAEAIVFSGAGTKLTALRAILFQALRSAVQLLSGLSWHRRIQGVSMVGDMMQVVPMQLLGPNLGSVVLAMLRLLPGPFWTGKERIFKALSTIIQKSPASIAHCFHNPNALFCLGPHASNDDTGLLTIISVADVLDSSSQAVRLSSSRNLKRAVSRLDLPDSKRQNSEESAVEEFVPPNSSWCLTWSGVLAVLLHEAQKRGVSREHRVQVAGCVSELSWSHFCDDSTEEIKHKHLILLTWMRFCVPFLECSGMSSELLVAVVDCFMAALRSAKAEGREQELLEEWERKKEDCLKDVAALEDAQAVMETQKPPEAPPKRREEYTRAAQRTQFDMFGGRYSDKSDSGNSSSSAQPPAAKRKSEETTAMSRELEPPSKDLPERRSLDPASRQSFLLALARSCPSRLALHALQAEQGKVVGALVGGFLPLGVAWAGELVRSQVWSVRRSALLLLPKLMDWCLLCDDNIKVRDVLKTSLEAFTAGAREGKHPQVRVAAAEGLLALIRLLFFETSPRDGTALLKDRLSTQEVSIFNAQISKLLDTFSTDSSPSVLSFHAEAIQLWELYRNHRFEKSVEKEN